MLPRQDDARDICQETFLRILKSSDRFRDGSRFSTWMYQIALNLCRDQQRRRQRWGRILSADPAAAERASAAPSAEGDPGRVIERGETTRAVQWALAQIPAEQREVLILKEFEGLRFREIAELLGCPESTVKSRMYYGLDGVRRALERQGVREA
jgi:RNA polymerase sigma-70 factor (ECF subfamily)